MQRRSMTTARTEITARTDMLTASTKGIQHMKQIYKENENEQCSKILRGSFTIAVCAKVKRVWRSFQKDNLGGKQNGMLNATLDKNLRKCYIRQIKWRSDFTME